MQNSLRNQNFRTQIFSIKIFANFPQFQPTQTTQKDRRRAGALQTKIGECLVPEKEAAAPDDQISSLKFFSKCSRERERTLGNVCVMSSFHRGNFRKKFQDKISQHLFQDPRLEKISTKKFPEKISTNSCFQPLRKFAIFQNLWYNIRGICFGWRGSSNLSKILPLKMNIYSEKMNIYPGANLYFLKFWCII